jgi:hypothetical protein
MGSTLTLEQHHEPQAPYRNGLDTSPPPSLWADSMAQLTPDQKPRAEAKTMRERVIEFFCNHADVLGFALSGIVIIATVLVTA